MKIISTFAVVVTASITLLQPAQGRSRGSGHSFSPAPRFSAPAGHFSSRPRNFSGSGPRFYHSSQRFSSQAFRNRAPGSQFAVNRKTALNSRAYSASNARRAALRSQGFNNQGRVLTQHTRNWDRHRDHFWHGHRCRWYSNAWVIIDPWFYPWGFGYGYPYGAYSYYDDGYYDDGSVSGEYSQEPYPAQSENDSRNSDFNVSEVQSALARAGYYHDAIDGSVGPATRKALRRFQRDRGLDVTGRIERPVIEALGLR
jgi:hypothetical protein